VASPEDWSSGEHSSRIDTRGHAGTSTFSSAFWPSNTKRDHFAFEVTCSMIWASDDGDMSGTCIKSLATWTKTI
jgi:hypothetical protein